MELIEQELLDAEKNNEPRSTLIQIKRRLKKARLASHNSTAFILPTSDTPIDPLDFCDISSNIHPSLIVPPNLLYIGSYRLVSTVMQRDKTFHQLKIRNVINVSKEIEGVEHDSRFQQMKITVKDRPTEDLSQYFAASNALIEQSLSNQIPILVHCRQGASRSATIIVAYLLFKTISNVKLDVQTILTQLKAIRNVISPNTGFVLQLEEYYSRLIVERLLNVMFGPDSGKSGYRNGIDECIARLGYASNYGLVETLQRSLHWIEKCGQAIVPNTTSSNASSNASSKNTSSNTSSNTNSNDQKRLNRLSVVILQSLKEVIKRREWKIGIQQEEDCINHALRLVRERKAPHSCWGLLLKVFQCVEHSKIEMSELFQIVWNLVGDKKWTSIDNFCNELSLVDLLFQNVGRKQVFDVFIHAAEKEEEHAATVLAMQQQETSTKGNGRNSGGGARMSDAPLKALVSLVVNSSKNVGNRHALIERMQQSSIPGRTKRCQQMIKSFQLNIQDFPEIALAKDIGAISWMLRSEHFDLLQATVEKDEATPVAVTTRLQHNGSPFVPWPKREWLTTTLRDTFGIHHSLTKYHVGIWYKELEENYQIQEKGKEKGKEKKWWVQEVLPCNRNEWYVWVDQHLMNKSAAALNKNSVSSGSIPTRHLTLEDVCTSTGQPYIVQFVNTTENMINMIQACTKISNNKNNKTTQSSVLAFDFEWHPAYDNELALAQLAYDNVVYLVDVHHLSDDNNMKWIQMMETFGSGELNRKLVGFGVSEDLKMISKMKRKLKQETSSLRRNSPGLIDLRTYTGKTKTSGSNGKKKKGGKGLSLASLVFEHLGMTLDKTCTMTDWRRRPLGRPQIVYAALDA